MCSDVKNLEFILEKIDDAISYRDNYRSIDELLNSTVKIHLPKLKTDIEVILSELKKSKK